MQNYNSLKDYILAAENGRKKKQRPVRKEKFIRTANHPAGDPFAGPAKAGWAGHPHPRMTEITSYKSLTGEN